MAVVSQASMGSRPVVASMSTWRARNTVVVPKVSRANCVLVCSVSSRGEIQRPSYKGA